MNLNINLLNKLGTTEPYFYVKLFLCPIFQLTVSDIQTRSKYLEFIHTVRNVLLVTIHQYV